MKAYLKNYAQSPRKVRLVAGLIKGKNVGDAISELNFLTKRAADPILKLLKSAAANAKANEGIDMDSLIVKNVLVDKGLVMRRVERKARGSANILHKRMSNIEIILDTKKGETNTKNKGRKVANKKDK